MLLTLPIRAVLPATPRARIVEVGLEGRPFPFIPGQAVLLGSAGSPTRRPYSLAAAPEDVAREGCLEFLIGVDEQGRPGPHLALEPGALVDVDGPAGSFTFPERPTERRFVFVAGGTGIAPLRSMLRHALAKDLGDIAVSYSARQAGEFAYQEELLALARQGRIHFTQTVTRDADSAWSGHRGRLARTHLLPLIQHPDDPAALCFVCGPTPLVQHAWALLQEMGVPPERIRVEEWAVKPRNSSAPTSA